MTLIDPEYHSQEEFLNRSRKLEEIKQLGIDPFPPKFSPAATPGDIIQRYQDQELGHSEDAEKETTVRTSVAGRLILFRAMGKNAFAHIQDETGRIQILFNRDHTHVVGYHPTPEMSTMKFIEKKIDLGDILGIDGYLFRTQKGEITLFAKTVTLLCKSLLPLPDKHSGLVDKGVRYRKRWVDLIDHPDVVQTFLTRSRILRLVRNYFEKEGFIEVETPVLQNVYGGAQARPFTTQLHALQQEMFLRISLEIPLKKLIVGGHLKIFEMGKVFRNEGIDRTHNPEFTELEAYAAYWDYNDMMHLTEHLFAHIAQELFGTTQLSITPEKAQEPITIDLKTPWKRLSMKDSLKTYAFIDIDDLTEEQIRDRLYDRGKIDPKTLNAASRGALIAMLFEEFVEEHLIQPHHIIDHPIETTPLCKLHRNPKLRDEKFVERFETFILGGEFCNSYTELNDPVLQRELLLQQAQKRAAGDLEAPPLDEEFIEAICQGMPPTGGLGIGIDRLCMLFLKAHSIRDVLYFPIMRPEE
ncbi:MAG TPA: lysine--tRNA ligase [Rhabdochlamydiaceae bacterium]|jgi:lysyl-tRNA synthetase class 2